MVSLPSETGIHKIRMDNKSGPADINCNDDDNSIMIGK